MAATATPPPNEKLPRGVGRVPTWWMELTPHYTLDLEEDQNRREQEEQEALYYASMAALDDTRTAGEWKSNWGGRSTKDGGSNSGGPDGGLFGGRNFQPGTEGWDPKQWGIKADDPDYQSYLKGAKLPQSYIDAMKSFAGQAGLKYDATNLNHSKYGRQAEKPAFTPAWAKKKLKKTGQGQSIRQGLYHDSPNKHLHRVNDHLHRVKEKKAEEGDSSPSPAPPQTPPTPANPPAPAPAPTPAPAPAVVHTTTLPMPSRSNTPAAASPAVEPPEEKQKKYNFNDYYYNAGTTTPAAKFPVPAPPEQAPPSKPAAPAPAPSAPTHSVAPPSPSPPAPVAPPFQPKPEEEEEYEEVVEYVEEYEDGEEGEEYEEVVEYEEEYEDEEQAEPEAAPVVPQSANLSDLQLLLAQKQAELAKLQGM